jgi:hypothetical protein
MYPLLEVFKELIGTAADEFAKKWGDQVGEWLWNRTSSDHGINADALLKIRCRVVERLEAAGAPADEATRVGDSVVSVLVEQPSLLREVVGAK